MSDGVEFRVRDGIARIQLDRPTHGNALNLAAAEALGVAVAAAANDLSVRCVVLIGTGRFFCTGCDVASFAAPIGAARSSRTSPTQSTAR